MNTDTVLKWVTKGLLKATRTAGGHYRIERQDLEALLAARTATPHLVQHGEAKGLTRCWEYFAVGGEVQPECQGCVVYQIRASWCFKVGTPGCELGPARHRCETECEECSYFLRVRGKALKVLVVSPDGPMIQQLAGKPLRGVEVGFARNGYEASAVLCSFRPNLVIVDEDLLGTKEAGLLEYLAADARIQGVRAGVAVENPLTGRYAAHPPANAAFLVEKPLVEADLQALARRFAVEEMPEEETAARVGVRGAVRR